MSGDANQVSTKHPHEPAVAPVYDPEGRCLVCGCLWRDDQIVHLAGRIEALVHHLRTHNPECFLLPENIDDFDGWEREAHGHPAAAEQEGGD